MSFLGASRSEWVGDHEEARRSQFCWRFKDSEAWDRNPDLLLMGPSEIVNKCAVCG